MDAAKVAPVWRPHFEQYEGRTNYLYLDGKGKVTIAVGCVIQDPMLLNWLRKVDDQPPTRDQIFDEYNGIKAQPNGKGAAFYAALCKLYITDREIDTLFVQRLTLALTSVEKHVCSLDGYPDDAALAAVDMDFNLGDYGFWHGFPKFVNAFVAKDWHTCALECRRLGIQQARNDWTRNVFEQLDKAKWQN